MTKKIRNIKNMHGVNAELKINVMVHKITSDDRALRLEWNE